MQDGKDLIDQKKVDEQIQEEKRIKRRPQPPGSPKPARCSKCAKTGHNVRSSPEDI